MRTRIWAAHFCWIFLCVGSFCLSQWGIGGVLPSGVERTIAPFFERVTGTFRDIKLRVRGTRTPAHPIVILDIDSESIEQLGRWPWRRDYLAELITETFKRGASVVGLDILFPDAQEGIPEELRDILKQQKLGDLLEVFDYDKRLAEVFAQHPDRLISSWASNNICQPAFSTPEDCPVFHPEAAAAIPKYFPKFSLTGLTTGEGFRRDAAVVPTAITPMPNLPQFDAAVKHSGFVNRFSDVDGLVRRVSSVVLLDGKAYPSLPLQMAQVIRKDRVLLDLESRGTIGAMKWEKAGTPVPTSRAGRFDVDFLGPGRRFPFISARELFLDPGDRQVASEKANPFKDAYVLVGISALAVGDVVASPFDPQHPGVEVHATVLENLLSDSLLDTGRGSSLGFALLAWMLIVGLLGAYIGQRWEAVPAIAMVLSLFVVSLFVDFRLFWANYDLPTGFWYAQVLGSLGITIVGRYIMEQNDKKFLRGAFAKYVAPAVVDSIVKDPKALSLGGRRETLTIMFSDVRGFTTLSEKLDARTISEFLNDFLGMQTEIVFQHGGTLDKYIGDAVMAFWGAPLSLHDHAAKACAAAIAITQALEDNRPRYLEKYGIHVHMGIGLHTGEVSVGNMGSSRSFSYTVIGDNVNLSSRLEGATKAFGVEILTTRATLDEIARLGLPVPAHRSLAATKVKGKKNAVELIELVRGTMDSEGRRAFEEGVALYAKRDFAGAIRRFRVSEKALAHGEKLDTTSSRYIELCEEFLKEPPGADWDGTWSLTDK